MPVSTFVGKKFASLGWTLTAVDISSDAKLGFADGLHLAVQANVQMAV